MAEITRYCAYCGADQKFHIESMEQMENLICPICGAPVGRNSRHPDTDDTKKIEEGIGAAFSVAWWMGYIYYLVCALIGIPSYFLHWDMTLFIVTGLAIGAFLLQIFTKSLFFKSGLLFLPLGGLLGFYLLRTLQGACLGILIVFLIRHLLRDIWFKIVEMLIRWGNSGQK